MPLIIMLLTGLLYILHANQDNPDQVVVFFKNNKQIQALSVIKKKNNIALVKVPEGENIHEFINKLKKDPSVSYVIPNYKIKALAVPNDTYYDLQWYLKKIEGEQAWDLSTGSDSVYVAVLDSGMDYNHPDLKNNLWINTGETTGNDSDGNGIDDGCEDGVDSDNNGYKDDCYGFNAVAGEGSALDGYGHGTHVSGIIGAVGNNNEGVTGVNWTVKIIPCKFLNDNGEGDLYSLLQCLNYLKSLEQDKGISIAVINGSYGYIGNTDALNVDCNLYPQTEKCLIASLSGVFVAAAGNGGLDGTGDNNDSTVFLPCNYSTVLNNVICVGATDDNDQKTFYSNYGFNSVNIFAPGGSSLDQTCSKGILSTYTYSDDGDSTNDFYCAIGTSAAAPVVSGSIALLKAYSPSLSTDQLINRVLSSGDNLISLSGYSGTCNRVNMYKTLNGDSTPKICFDKHISEDSTGYYHDFGTALVKTPNTFSLTIRSTGGSNLQIGNVSLEQADVFTISHDGCSGKSLSFSQECSIELTLYSDTAGTYNDTLYIPTNTVFGQIDIKISATVNDTVQTASSTGSGGGGGCQMSQTGSPSGYFLILVVLLAYRLLKKYKTT